MTSSPKQALVPPEAATWIRNTTVLLFSDHGGLVKDSAQELLHAGFSRENIFCIVSRYYAHVLQSEYALDADLCTPPPWAGAALHFAVHLIVLDQAASPEWDRPRIHQVAMGCVSLFERRRAEYQRGSVHIAMRLSRPAAVRLSGEALLVLVPCARALLADQDVDRALGWADRAATLRPRDPQILELAAIARARAGEFTGAGLALATLHQLSPQTDLSPLERRFEAARSLAAEPRPTDAKARALYDARLLLTLGTPEGARRALAPAIALAPTDHELVHTLAQTFVSEKRFDQAAAVLERGAALEPEDPFWALAVEALGRARAEAPELPRP